MSNLNKQTLAAAVAWLASFSCVDTGTENVELQLYVAGSSQHSFESDDGWLVTLEEARLAFGPLTLCPGANAGPFCSTAVAEWLDSTVVDVLEEEPTLAGSLIGSDGVVQGFMYDLGFVNLLSNERPLTLDAAKALDDNSLTMRGSAVKGERRLELDISVALFAETGSGVPIFLSASFQALNQDLGEVSRVTLQFEPTKWLRTVRFDTLAEAECQQTCPDAVNFQEGTQAESAVRIAVTANPPVFEWE